MGAEIGAAIQLDAGAMAALQTLPPDLRSTADAVMLWNGEWVSAVRPETQPAVLLLQQVIERSILAAKPECRFALNAGPRFIPVTEGERTTMIVVGSGEWHWDSLLGLLPAPAGTAFSAAAPAPAPRPPGRPTSWWEW